MSLKVSLTEIENEHFLSKRRSGILLHITSLPSPYGIGDLGPSAYRFADFLSQAKQRFWQILPLNPTDPAFGNSPYHSLSAFAANTLLISPELLFEDGLLEKEELNSWVMPLSSRVYFEPVRKMKESILERAWERYKKKGEDSAFEEFSMKNMIWLDDYALFVALKENFRGKQWSEWPKAFLEKEKGEMEKARRELQGRIEKEKFLQYIFWKQWHGLKTYCNQRGIKIIGDIPIYVIYDSVDVWKNAELFKLGEDKKPKFIAGVPPDYFSKKGQLWGTPVYDWEKLRERGYEWWFQRIEHNLRMYDVLRIDHFRGFVAYWEVQAPAVSAVSGKWAEAPALDFFSRMKAKFNFLPFIAEDLGIITQEVIEVMNRFNFPGMKVLLFAFGKDDPHHPYLPHNYGRNSVVYTGTHDNNTVRGWFRSEAQIEEKKRLFRYLGREVSEEEVHWEFIRLAMMSVSNLAIIPMQDVLGLGEEARMNRPSTKTNNWEWRLFQAEVPAFLIQKLSEMINVYGRA